MRTSCADSTVTNNPLGTSGALGIVLFFGTVCSAPSHQYFGSSTAARRVEQDQEFVFCSRRSSLSKCQGAKEATRPPVVSTDPLQSAGVLSGTPNRNWNEDWLGSTPREFSRSRQPAIITTARRASEARIFM